MKIFKKGLCALITITLLFTAFPMLAFAAEESPAGKDSSGKEEVVYVMADAAGAPSGIYVVNIFGSGSVTDYGEYSQVKMMNTNDKITQTDDKIAFSTNAARAYYQGTMKSTQIPWDISIRYFMDGTEYSPKDIAGKSGKLEIHFKVSKNERFSGSFWDDYALQAAFTLDTGRCGNITAPDATVADVGSDKQLSYTILPGKGIDTVITADAKDFEMDAASINAVKLNLHIDIDDKELMDKVGELIAGMADINDGALTLYDGTGDLKDGSQDLVGGAGDLKSGMDSLNGGIAKLKEGIDSAQSGLSALDRKSGSLTGGSAEVKKALLTIQSSISSVSLDTDGLSKLTSASGAIKTGIGNLLDGAEQLKQNLGFAQYKALLKKGGLDIDALKQGNTQAVSSLESQITGLKATLAGIEGVPGYESQVAQLKAQIAELENVVTLLNGNNAAIGGTQSYLDGVSGAAGELYTGVSGLKDQYEAFDSAIGDMADTLTGMTGKLGALSAGIDTLVTKYTALDDGIGEYTGGVAKLAAGYDRIMEGVSDLAKGGKTLAKGSGSLYDGAEALYDGVASLTDGARDLSDGTEEMHEKTADMDSQVEDQIDDMLASIEKGDSKTVSFVSQKNTNVKSVQFVIKTDAVEKPESAPAAGETAEKLTFWQKLIRLFGIG